MTEPRVYEIEAGSPVARFARRPAAQPGCYSADQTREAWLRFEWDPSKAAENVVKHGVSFEEAATVFRDTLSATGADPDHSFSEERFITFGISRGGRLLVVAHTDRDDDTIRIISARRATPHEREIYEEG